MVLCGEASDRLREAGVAGARADGRAAHRRGARAEAVVAGAGAGGAVAEPAGGGIAAGLLTPYSVPVVRVRLPAPLVLTVGA